MHHVGFDSAELCGNNEHRGWRLKHEFGAYELCTDPSRPFNWLKQTSPTKHNVKRGTVK